ncbi:ABC transporter substrate-binding protein [Ruania zhangjianzhongii]|uniref:ABC transporter substrate-binding protein n=1 Tax=Ruania zhangjianzhongii TaxID=2603206 RepID=UPI00143D6370|nr:ABC transporter substrate-binding protein [Ruania zhangjianzhongii]
MGSVALLLLGACGQADNLSQGNDEATDGGDAVEIRVAWWGSEGRHEQTQEALAVCEAAIGNITTSAEFASQGYDDRLATQFAAGNPPDIIQVVSGAISSYGQRGGLLDIATVEEYIDTSAISPGVLNADAVDGTLYSIPITTNASGLVLNVTMMEEYGLERPDDENWNWDDLFDYASSVSEASDGEVWGLQQPSEDIRLLNIWARQLGHLDGLYTETGVGLDTGVVASFLQYGLDLQESGGSAPASISVEHQGGGIEQTMIGTSRALLAVRPINEITALHAGTGSEFELLQLPTHEAGQTGQTFRSMSWSITSETAHPVEAAQLLDCLQGNLEAAEILQAERGIPANGDVVEHIREDLSPEQQMMADFVATVEADAPEVAPMPPPPGADTAEEVLRRYAEEMLFGQFSPEEAAEQFANELDQSISAAN